MLIPCTVLAQAYAFENMSLDLKLVRTNYPPRTIMRSPGFINSVMIIEQVYSLKPQLLLSVLSYESHKSYDIRMMSKFEDRSAGNSLILVAGLQLINLSISVLIVLPLLALNIHESDNPPTAIQPLKIIGQIYCTIPAAYCAAILHLHPVMCRVPTTRTSLVCSYAEFYFLCYRFFHSASSFTPLDIDTLCS